MTITGYVKDGVTKKPIPGARVDLYWNEEKEPFGKNLVSDEEGRVSGEIDGQYAGTVKFTVEATGYEPFKPMSYPIIGRDITKDLELIREKPYPLWIKIAVAAGTIAGIGLIVWIMWPKDPRIMKFEVAPQEISQGDAVTLSWNVLFAAEVLLNGQKVDPKGTQTEHPKHPTHYTLLAKNNKGEKTETKQVTFTKDPAIIRFVVDPPEIPLGMSTIITWKTMHADEVMLNGEKVDVEGKRRETPKQSTTYTLVARNKKGKEMGEGRDVTVTSGPALPPPSPNCISFNPNKVTARPHGLLGNKWTVVEGDKELFNFGKNGFAAEQLVAVIKNHGLEQICTIKGAAKDFRYTLGSAGKADASGEGAVPDEKCTTFQPNTVSVKKMDGQWKIIAGSQELLEFGDSKPNADAAKGIIKKYGFSHACGLPKGNPQFWYLRRG
jgi:hypothetical protein